MRRLAALSLLTAVLVTITAGPALACGGLIGPNGAVNLLRTTTLAAYHDGVEHYVTSFQFAGTEDAGAFGSIVPLPGVPTNVEKGGDWTLQRLIRETQPQLLEAAAASADGESLARAEVLLETKIDALDITVLRGGGQAVGEWAAEQGFRLPPDAPEVLDFYARRSPIFLAAQFDGSRAAAQGLGAGDGTPIHVTIPTDDPWVPLRILALGLRDDEPVQADVYLLTDRRPSTLPEPGGRGLFLDRSDQASPSLLSDLRSDRGMEWVPDRMWLTYLRVDGTAADVDYDLAVDAAGGVPSREDAGFDLLRRVAAPVVADDSALPYWLPALAAVVLAAAVVGWSSVLSRRAHA